MWSFFRPAIGKLFRMQGQHAVGRGCRESERGKVGAENAEQVGSGGGRCVSPCPACQHKMLYTHYRASPGSGLS